MSQGDSWTERYLALIPEKLTAADAKILIELMCEDPERLAQALKALADEAADAKDAPRLLRAHDRGRASPDPGLA